MGTIIKVWTQKRVEDRANIGLKIEKESLIFNKPIVSTSSNIWHPPTDVYETEGNIVVNMAISGLKKCGVSIRYLDKVLTISGNRHPNFTHSKLSFYQAEIRYGYFERKIVIPKPIKEDKIHSTYADGFLQIIIPLM